jgi:tryptophan synthase alpha chain
MITPDLTPEEAGPWLEAADKQGLDPIFLVAPSSTDERVPGSRRCAAASCTPPRSWA